jgi:hypothetical protein
MKLNRLGLLSVLSMFAFVPCSASASSLDSAEAFLGSIYDHYVGLDGETTGVVLDDNTVTTLFEPELAELILIDRLEADRDQEPPRLNGDPFVGRQDWIISGYEIAMSPANEGQDEVRLAARLDFDTPHPIGAVQLHLVWMGDTWRISEIEWDYATLREILEN